MRALGLAIPLLLGASAYAAPPAEVPGEVPDEAAPPPVTADRVAFVGGIGVGDILWGGLLVRLDPQWHLHAGTGLNITYLISGRFDARLAAQWIPAPSPPAAVGDPWTRDFFVSVAGVRTLVGNGLYSNDSAPPQTSPAESWAVEAGFGWRWGDADGGLRVELLGRVDYFDDADPNEVRYVVDSRWLVSPGLRLGFDD